MNVAGIQFDIAWENPAENFRRVAPLAQRAAAEGAELLALPEMFATGFTMRSGEMATHANAIHEFMAETATRHGVWLIGGALMFLGSVAIVVALVLAIDFAASELL